MLGLRYPLQAAVLDHDIATHLLRRGSCRSGTRGWGGFIPPGRLVSISADVTLVLVLHASHLYHGAQSSGIGPLLLSERFKITSGTWPTPGSYIPGRSLPPAQTARCLDELRAT